MNKVLLKSEDPTVLYFGFFNSVINQWMISEIEKLNTQIGDLETKGFVKVNIDEVPSSLLTSSYFMSISKQIEAIYSLIDTSDTEVATLIMDVLFWFQNTLTPEE